MPAFPTTHHSVIERLRSHDEEPRREAFGDLVDGYWKPVYKYLRIKWRLPADAAEDAAQTFFAEALEKAWFDRFDPSKDGGILQIPPLPFLNLLCSLSEYSTSP